jgi:hypothetical protein
VGRCWAGPGRAVGVRPGQSGAGPGGRHALLGGAWPGQGGAESSGRHALLGGAGPTAGVCGRAGRDRGRRGCAGRGHTGPVRE